MFVSVGVSGCLGAGCVVGGGGLPLWLGGAVASGGVGVGFDVGLRVFVLSGVSVPALSSGSVSSLAVSGSSPVGSAPSLSPSSGGVSGSVGSVSGSVSASGGSAPASGSAPSPVSGVVVCVPCAVRVFGDSWCSLVLRRWARAAGVNTGLVDTLLGSAPGSGSIQPVASGSAPSSRASVVSSGFLSSSLSPVSGGSVSASGSSRAGRVGVGFGARVRDWGACVGVGGGVVSGGGVVASWWARARGRVSALVSGVGVWGLVLACVVGVVVLVSVLVLVG